MNKRTIITLLLSILIGITIGVGAYTFIYAKGGSYLTNDPSACANCHIMSDHFNSWIKSSHHAAAVCNDCHTPEGFFPKYFTKASNGFWHSYGFTTGWFPDPIQIKQRNREIANEACEKCHQDMIAFIESNEDEDENEEEARCIQCHNTVGHL